MEEKKTIILDLSGCKYLGELHERIRIAFSFPEWYGANLDALWDLLRSDCDADEVIIRHSNTLPDELKEYIKKVYEIFDKNVIDHEKYRRIYNDIKSFSYRIEN